MTNRFLAVLCCLLTVVAAGFGQDRGIETDLDSPYEAVYQHLANLAKDNWHPDISVKALKYRGVSYEEAKRLAIKLKKIYEGKALVTDYDEIPKDINYLDSATKKNIYVPFEELPEIYVQKYGDKWYYSRESVRHINELYDKTFPYSIEEVFGEEMPDFLKWSFLGMYTWQYIGILIYTGLAVLIYFLIKLLLKLLLTKYLARIRNWDIISVYVLPVSSRLSFLVALVLFASFLPALKLPLPLVLVFTYIFKVLIPALVAYILYKACDLVADIFDTFIFKSKSKIIGQTVPLVRKSLKIIVVTISVIVILQSLDVPITALLAGVSLGGLALALAAQDTVKHLFGSVTIFTDRPFEVGDWVIFDGKEGIVEEVGLRSTRVRTFYDSLITVPNGKLTDMVIDNMGKRNYRRYLSKISITYDTPPDLIEAFIGGLRKIVESHSDVRKDNYQIYLNEFDNSSLNILFLVFFEVEDYSAELQAKHGILLDIIRIADELGVNFAFPTRTLHLEPYREQSTGSPEFVADREEFMKKVDEYFARKKKDAASVEMDEARNEEETGEKKENK